MEKTGLFLRSFIFIILFIIIFFFFTLRENFPQLPHRFCCHCSLQIMGCDLLLLTIEFLLKETVEYSLLFR